MAIESAIPEHLQTERNLPSGKPDDYVPPVPAVSARLDPSITQVAMAYFGVQYEGEQPQVATEALRDLDDQSDAKFAPTHGIDATYVDEAGFTNRLAIRYWPDVAAYDAWRQSRTDWTDPSRYSPDAGFFSEVITPTTDRFETIFSEGDEMEGVAVGVGHTSGHIREHSYWGSARDRLPISQTDRLEPGGEPSIEEDGQLRVVRPLQNLVLIQSGQDWSAMPQDQQRVYLDEVEPRLATAMTFLQEEGKELGCIANRYLTVLDRNGDERQRRFGLSWWRDLAGLEEWAAAHPTHKAVFKSAMPVMMDSDPQRRIWLYHEVSVLTEGQQDFRYLGCHDRTGMLGVYDAALR